MLPVQSWPPRAPGTDLSPFGAPRCVPSGFVLPKGAWVVMTNAASVVMCVRKAYADIWGRNPTRVPGTEVLPGNGTVPPQPGPMKAIPPTPPKTSNAWPSTPVTGGGTSPPPTWAQWRWPTADQLLEGFRAWQRQTGNTDRAGPPIGRTPPNWFGPWTDTSPAIQVTLLQPGSNGVVLSDGQNVKVWGSGAMVMRAASV